MIETTVKIGGVTIPTILLFAIASLAVVTLIFWYLRHRRGESQGNNEDTFDIVFFGVILGLLTARLVGFIGAFGDYSSIGWSIDPLRDVTGDFAPLDALPWVFLKVWDGNLNYQVIGFGSLLGAWLIASNKRRIEDLRMVLDKYIVAAVVGQVVLIIGTFLTGVYFGKEYDGPFALDYAGGKRFPVQLFELITLAAIFVAMNMAEVRNKKGRKVGVYLLLSGVSQFILGFMFPGGDANSLVFGTAQIVGIVMVLLSLVFFGESKKKKDQDKLEIPVKRVESLDAVQGKERPGYSVSYGVGKRWKGEQSDGVLKRIFKKK